MREVLPPFDPRDAAFFGQEITLPFELRHSLANELGFYYGKAYDAELPEHDRESARYNYLIARTLVESHDSRVDMSALADDFTAGMGDGFDAGLFIDSFAEIENLVVGLGKKIG